MIGHSWPEYVFIRAAILALRLIAPLSVIYLAASYHAGAFLFSPFLGIYALVEAAFFLLVYWPRSFYLQRDAKHPPRMSRAEREALFHKCANSMTSDSISGWFIRSPRRHIWRDNVVDWLLWALFSARSSDAVREWEEELNYYTTVMGDYVGYPLSPGSDPEMQCLRLTMDAVYMVHRPFVWYMVVCLVDTLTAIALYSYGFTHYHTRKWFHAFPPRPLLALFSRASEDTETNIPYWYRPHRSRTKLPILFIHGIGIGLFPYVPFFHELAAQDPDVGILAIEILPICMHITTPPLARDAMCAAITRILDAHGLRRIVVTGHSYGTVVAAHLLRRQWDSVSTLSPHRHTQQPDHEPLVMTTEDGNRVTDEDDGGQGGIIIAAALLIDPIPFLLHHPAVAYNFVYRQPRRANEWQLWYFASRDADIARALSRHFFWFESILFREDVLPALDVAGIGPNASNEGNRRRLPVAVSLAGRDQIVDANAVRAYLTGGEGEEGADAPAAAAEGMDVDVDVPSRHHLWKREELEVLYFPELDHATVFDARQDRAALLEVLSRFVRRDEDEAKAETEATDAASGTTLASPKVNDLVDLE